MSFSFNFDPSEDGVIQEENAGFLNPSWFQEVDAIGKTKSSSSIIEVSPPCVENPTTALFRVNGIPYKRLREIGEHDIDADSDLIPGVYGGGLKIWECTMDLMRYMKENAELLFPHKHCQVLELGCGHGFPGIVAMLLGYQNVTFLDLNLEVIRDVTWPNILINVPIDRTISKDIRCFAGDWLSFGNFSVDR